MNPMVWSKVLAAAGCVVLAAGVYGQFGLWWGLIVTGTLTSALALVAVDVDDPDKEGPR